DHDSREVSGLTGLTRFAYLLSGSGVSSHVVEMIVGWRLPDFPLTILTFLESAWERERVMLESSHCERVLDAFVGPRHLGRLEGREAGSDEGHVGGDRVLLAQHQGDALALSFKSGPNPCDALGLLGARHLALAHQLNHLALVVRDVALADVLGGGA